MCILASVYDPTLTIEKMRVTESQYFDRKSARIANKDLAPHISAMANAAGGVVAVGIENDGRISGITAEQENSLRQMPMDCLRALPELREEILTTETGMKIFLFHISPSPDEVIKLKNGEAYLRVGDSSRKLSAEQLLEWNTPKGSAALRAKW